MRHFVMLAAVAALLFGGSGLLETEAWGQRVQGVDVSYWQGTMDWNRTYDAGARFAFVRSSRGEDFEDTFLTTNMAAIAQLATSGKPILAGVYHFGRPGLALSTASTAAQIQSHAQSEAGHFVQTAGEYMKAGWLRPVLDLEEGGAELTRAQLSQWATEFTNHVMTLAQVEPLLYMNTNYATNEIDSSLAERDLWVANYNSGDRYGNPLTDGSPPTGNIDDWAFWQYTSEGSGPLYGVDPNFNDYIDLNVANGDMDFVRSFVITSSVPEPGCGLSLLAAGLWVLGVRRRNA
ncbi:glycoside hydrolase family 25 protein [Aureliella helgolandensis]|uniref:Lysozyme M1 n=1 Tax=Aureliella helgolandensis TaxID=2527968 RepID=A0A518GF38_9BACT|nr:glycoside hydrolase family 25 protein [Aureliella helgolandensis]QDV27209.1 Lysozyme M1 precursor [Aureliella helgolandensis]